MTYVCFSKFFHDAVPNIKTLASLTLIHDLLASGDVTGRVADTWVSSLAFSEQIPTAEMVEVAKVWPMVFWARALSYYQYKKSHCGDKTISLYIESPPVHHYFVNLRYDIEICRTALVLQTHRLYTHLSAVVNYGCLSY